MGARIVVVDYGMGNLRSVQNALHYLGALADFSGSPNEVAAAHALLLPGVGSFRAAMHALRTTGLDVALKEAVIDRGAKILGICLGMQLMGTRGTEDGDSVGLGFLPGSVERFSDQFSLDLKFPHIGFNSVTTAEDSVLMRGLLGMPDFYFVHSYRMLPAGLPGKVSTCSYGETFVAAYEHQNIFATQFHPEKSQTNGLLLLKNFLSH
jgi:glutamine amidotransferase